MQEPHMKGVANHHGPESCVAARKDGSEALTGGSAGQPSSSVIRSSGAPTLSHQGESHTGGGDKSRAAARPRGVEDPAINREPPPGPAESKTLR